MACAREGNQLGNARLTTRRLALGPGDIARHALQRGVAFPRNFFLLRTGSLRPACGPEELVAAVVSPLPVIDMIVAARERGRAGHACDEGDQRRREQHVPRHGAKDLKISNF